MGAITKEQLANIATYGVADLVEDHRGEHVSWAVAMAMAEHEDTAFHPGIYNFYIPDPKGGKTSHLGVAYAEPHAPLVTRWAKPGDGGCAFDPHACGQYQILDQIRLDQGGYGGVKLPYLNDLFDVAKNVQAALAARGRDAERLVAAGVTDPTLFALLLYFAHAEGIGKLIGGKYEGAFARLKREGKPLTWAALCALPWGEPGWWKLGNRLAGVAAAMQRVPLWRAAEPAIKGSAVVPAEDLPEAEPDLRPREEALLAEVQAAEMMRDLTTAARLREELVALVGTEGGLA